MTLHRFAFSLLLVIVAASSAVAADTNGHAAASETQASCSCPDPFDPAFPAGLVWQGPGPAPDLHRLAELLAPALWFSEDEPLILKRPENPIPHPHPCDTSNGKPVVYYQATAIVLRGSERVVGNGETDPEFFAKVDHFVLRFFFYYDEDFGIGPHPHDLEVVNMLVDLDRTPDGCFRILARRLEGLAHGVSWYSNILRLSRVRDTVFPLRVLVEEGKHASILDRNADGVYTPGYDVNARVTDAWGLRDVLGSSVLLGARFSASMAKPREDAFLLMPPNQEPVCGRQRRVPVSLESGSEVGLGRYELRPATKVPVCHPSGPEPERLRRMMRSHRFGSEWPTDQHETEIGRVLSDPNNLFRVISAINVRFDSTEFPIAVQGPGLEIPEVWLVPRVMFNQRGWAADILTTSSASRWIDWYLAMGYEDGLIERNDGTPNKGFGTELGIKFRMAVSGPARWMLLGYEFGGVRLGIRTNGFANVRQPRIIVELGAGVF
jgi:hypothetical protein